MVKILTLAALLALAGCQTTKGSYCALADAQRPSNATIDAMSDAEVERALIELEKLRRLCGVKP